MVTPRPSRRTRDRVRARGCRLPLAHVLRRRCDAPVLRLGRVRGALVRRRRGVQGGVVEGRGRLRAGRGCVALENEASGDGSRTRPYTSSRSSPASSSGDAIAFSPSRSSLGSARIPSTGTRSAVTGTRRLSARVLEAAFVAAVLVGLRLVVAPTLGQPLLERHAFRQTQTAYTARIFHEQGIDLIHPKLPVLGEPFEVPFEFPLFQAAASLVMDAGVRDDVAMRVTGLVCFLLTALLLYGLVRQVDGRVSGLAALVAFVSTPFAVLWSRTSMIEYLATAGAVGFAWATIAWRENRRPAVGGLALAAGLVGMLVKPTTAVFWMLPALGYRPTSRRAGDRRTGALWLVGTGARPTGGAACCGRGTRTRSRRQARRRPGSRATRSRESGTSERSHSVSTAARLGGDPGAGCGLHRRACRGRATRRRRRRSRHDRRQRLFWLGIVLAAVLPPLVFTNLYFDPRLLPRCCHPGHCRADRARSRIPWRLLPRRRSCSPLAWPRLCFSRRAHRTRYGATGPRHTPTIPAQANPLAHEGRRAHTAGRSSSGSSGSTGHPRFSTTPIAGGSWSSSETPTSRTRTHARGGYRYLLVAEPNDDDLSPSRAGVGWARSARTCMASRTRRRELPKSPFVATDDASEMPPGRRIVQRGFADRLRATARIPGGERGTMILASRSPSRHRVSASDELASLPARRAIYVSPELATGGR